MGRSVVLVFGFALVCYKECLLFFLGLSPLGTGLRRAAMCLCSHPWEPLT